MITSLNIYNIACTLVTCSQLGVTASWLISHAAIYLGQALSTSIYINLYCLIKPRKDVFDMCDECDAAFTLMHFAYFSIY